MVGLYPPDWGLQYKRLVPAIKAHLWESSCWHRWLCEVNQAIEAEEVYRKKRAEEDRQRRAEWAVLLAPLPSRRCLRPPVTARPAS